MAEASKSNPARRLMFAVALVVVSVVVSITSGPSGEFLEQNSEWLSWAPGGLGEHGGPSTTRAFHPTP